jgi:hypothetical protein
LVPVGAENGYRGAYSAQVIDVADGECLSERWWVVVDGGLVALAFASDAGGVFGGAGAFA